jgi:hypothetical protein
MEERKKGEIMEHILLLKILREEKPYSDTKVVLINGSKENGLIYQN